MDVSQTLEQIKLHCFENGNLEEVTDERVVKIAEQRLYAFGQNRQHQLSIPMNDDTLAKAARVDPKLCNNETPLMISWCSRHTILTTYFVGRLYQFSCKAFTPCRLVTISSGRMTSTWNRMVFHWCQARKMKWLKEYNGTNIT